jgi:hypothetical protein
VVKAYPEEFRRDVIAAKIAPASQLSTKLAAVPRPAQQTLMVRSGPLAVVTSPRSVSLRFYAWPPGSSRPSLSRLPEWLR